VQVALRHAIDAAEGFFVVQSSRVLLLFLRCRLSRSVLRIIGSKPIDSSWSGPCSLHGHGFFFFIGMEPIRSLKPFGMQPKAASFFARLWIVHSFDHFFFK